MFTFAISDDVFFESRGKCSIPFDREFLDNSAVIQNYKGRVIKISNVKAEKINTEAIFTEIEKSRFKEIYVQGSVYVHDCQSKIKKIAATGDVFLFRCSKVKKVVAQGNVFVCHLPPDNPLVCHYGSMETYGTFTAYCIVNN
jgi:hypothetical protein